MIPEARHGIIRGYKVSYEGTDGVIKQINVDGGDSREVKITGLKFLTNYTIKVLAYTSVGDGPESSEIYIRTDESSKSFYYVQYGISATEKNDNLTCEIIYGDFTCDDYC